MIAFVHPSLLPAQCADYLLESLQRLPVYPVLPIAMRQCFEYFEIFEIKFFIQKLLCFQAVLLSWAFKGMGASHICNVTNISRI